MNNESLLPRPSREETAQREIGQTDISRGTTWFLLGSFLLTLTVPPLAQLVYDLLPDPREIDHQQVRAHETIPSSLQLLVTLPAVTDAFRATAGGYFKKIITASQQLVRNFDEYERQLEERSLLNRELLGPTRTYLAKYGGIGSEQVEIGRDGWLFFRPDVEYLTGPGFLEPQFLSHRARSGEFTAAPPRPDPRPAILEFHQQLASHGIRLIVMPTPGKAALYPERLSGRTPVGVATRSTGAVPHPPNVSERSQGRAASIPLQNRSFDQFQEELSRAGVLVFDPAPVLAEAKRNAHDVELFLRTDTHWTPAGMQLVAKRMSDFIDSNSLLPQQPATLYEQRSLEVTNVGDIEAMLRLASNQSLFPPQHVTIRPIENRAGERWQSAITSDVLLLGDSYTNIYSMPELNWGSSAGLAEQLSFHLQRPVDRLAQNDGGSFAVRQTFFQELARGHDRLANKRLVIWQFSTRDLIVGDWKLQSMPAVPRNAQQPLEAEPVASDLIALGTIRATTGAPRPGAVPYREAITAIHLVEVTEQGGSPIASELVVYLWGLQDNQLTPAARFAAGQQLTLKLIPWDHVKDRYERFNRLELDDPDFHLAELPIYWGEVVK